MSEIGDLYDAVMAGVDTTLPSPNLEQIKSMFAHVVQTGLDMQKNGLLPVGCVVGTPSIEATTKGTKVTLTATVAIEGAIKPDAVQRLKEAIDETDG